MAAEDLQSQSEENLETLMHKRIPLDLDYLINYEETTGKKFTPEMASKSRALIENTKSKLPAITDQQLLQKINEKIMQLEIMLSGYEN